MKIISIPFFISLVFQTLNAQIIPFRLTTHNNLVIKAVVNQKDTLDLMLHSGVTDIMFIESALPKLKTIKFSGQVDSVNSWGGGKNSSDYSIKNTVRIGDFEFQKITIWKDQYSGPETDGKFGISLFENKFLSFNFDKKELKVADKLPRNLKKYEKLAIKYEQGIILLKAVCKIKDKEYEKEFMVHSGYAGDVLFDDKFVSENGIGLLISITSEKKLLDSFGNPVITKNGILPVIQIGKSQLKNIPVGFFEGVIGRQSLSVMGGDIFKRFNWIFDNTRNFVYLKQNKNFESRYSKL